MVYVDEIYSYLEKLQAYVEAQNNQINRIRKEVHDLKKEIQRMNDRTIKIEKIEYKFDQLKVETLEGTLNIGLTPNGSNIEDFIVSENEGKLAKVEQINKELVHDIKEEIEFYLENDGKNIVKDIGSKYSYELDDSYQHLIIADIKKQIEQRIQIYISQNLRAENTDKPKVKDEIINKVKNDIINAIEVFIKQLPRKEN